MAVTGSMQPVNGAGMSRELDIEGCDRPHALSALDVEHSSTGRAQSKILPIDPYSRWLQREIEQGDDRVAGASVGLR